MPLEQEFNQIAFDALTLANAKMEAVSGVLAKSRITIDALEAENAKLRSACRQILGAVLVGLTIAIAAMLHALVPHIIDLIGG